MVEITQNQMMKATDFGIFRKSHKGEELKR
jgi:hypothetical protein